MDDSAPTHERRKLVKTYRYVLPKKTDGGCWSMQADLLQKIMKIWSFYLKGYFWKGSLYLSIKYILILSDLNGWFFLLKKMFCFVLLVLLLQLSLFFHFLFVFWNIILFGVFVCLFVLDFCFFEFWFLFLWFCYWVICCDFLSISSLIFCFSCPLCSCCISISFSL